MDTLFCTPAQRSTLRHGFLLLESLVALIMVIAVGSMMGMYAHALTTAYRQAQRYCCASSIAHECVQLIQAGEPLDAERCCGSDLFTITDEVQSAPLMLTLHGFAAQPMEQKIHTVTVAWQEASAVTQTLQLTTVLYEQG